VGAVLIPAAPAAAAAGDLDPSFSGDGRAHPPSLAAGGVYSPLAIEPGGGLIVQNELSPAFSLSRLVENGEVDAAYGGEGIAKADFFGGSNDLRALAVDPDGAVVAAGSAGVDRDSTDAALARFLPSGALDASFGTDGMVTLDLARIDYFVAVVAGPGRSVTVLGFTSSGGGNSKSLIARFDPDGELDSSFSEDGIQMLDDLGGGSGTASATSLALGAEGTITVGVSIDSQSTSYAAPGVLRLTENGARDTSFSSDGLVTFEIAAETSPGPDVELTPIGGVLVAGTVTYPIPGGHRDGDVFAAELEANGELDRSFGVDGFRYVDAGGSDNGVDAELRSGGGWAISVGDSEMPYEFQLVALAPDGLLDTSFSADGRVSTDVSGVGSSDFGMNLEVDAEGRLVVLGGADGRSAVRPGRLEGHSVVRYLDSPGPPDADADGVLDADDHCPERYGEQRRGCRIFEVRNISFRFQPAIDDFRGSVFYAPAYRCSQGVVVKVFEKRAGADRLVGRSDQARTSEGNWDISALAPAGRYYARVVGRTVAEVGYCAGARSRIIRRPGRGR